MSDSSLTVRAVWLMAAKALAFAFSFALPLLLVRRLSLTEFGLYKQAFLVIGTAINILPLGFGMSAFYFLPRESERRGQVVLNILLFSIAVGLLAFLALVFRPELLGIIFNGADLVAYAPLIGLVILLWIVSSFLEVVAVANEELRLATTFIVAAQFTKTLTLVAAAISFSSVRALIFAAMIQGALQTAALLYYLFARFGAFWRSFDWGMMRTQLGYALPLGFAGLLYTLQLDLHNYFVSHEFGAAAYAIYAIGCFQLPLVSILGDSVGSVVIPRVSHLQKLGSHREIVELTALMMRNLAAVYFPIFLLLLVVGREFIVVLFTSQYLASWPIFAINLTLLPLGILVSACDPIMRAYAEHRYFLLKARIALLVVLLAALWFVTAHFGLVGAITVVVGVNCIERLIVALKAASILNLSRRDLPLFKDLGKLAVAVMMAGIVTALVRASILGIRPILLLVVCGVSFSLVYLAAILFLGVLSAGEREAIRRRLGWLRRNTPRRRIPEPLAEGAEQ